MKQTIFNIKTESDFQTACLETFLYQYENVEVYRKFVDFLKIDSTAIKEITEIPFLPIEMFKNHLVLDQNSVSGDYFQSSGTTQMTRSKHHSQIFHFTKKAFTTVSSNLSANQKTLFFLDYSPIIQKIPTHH